MKCRNCNQLDLIFERSPTIPYPGLTLNLLLSHVIPTRLEEEQSKRSIEAIEARLSQLQEHVAYLETVVQKLKAEQTCCTDEQSSLMESLRDHQSVSAPIRKIPDDALCEIFMAYVGSPGSFKHLPAALVLAGVCKRWRSVCVSTPRLWSQIFIHLHPNINGARAAFPSSIAYQAKANMLSMFTSRSGACALQVHIKNPIRPHHRENEPEMLQLFSDTIATSAERWQSLHIDCSGAFLEKIQQAINSRSSKSLPMLESMRVDWKFHQPGTSVLRIPSQQLQLFSMAPKLRHVSLGIFAPHLELPWGQLESWAGTLASGEQSVAILKKCPNLIRYSLTMHQTGPTMQPNDVLRHNLRSVALFASSGEIGQFQYFFRSVELPSLLDLRIRAVDDSWPHVDLFQFLPRSSCALQRLTLDPGIYFTYTELLLALHNVPGLVELEFTQRTGPEEYPAFNNHVLERLTLGDITASDSPSSTALLSNLRTLSLIGRFPSDITAALINMLGSRIQVDHEPKLQSLYLQPHPYDSDDESVPSAASWKASDAEQVKSTLANTELVIVIVDSGWDSCAFGELL